VGGEVILGTAADLGKAVMAALVQSFADLLHVLG
jgi:hypothetical protein